MKVVEEKGPVNGKEDYTQDGTVDLKGRPVLRSKTGQWKACSFIVGKMKRFAASCIFGHTIHYGISGITLCLYNFGE